MLSIETHRMIFLK